MSALPTLEVEYPKGHPLYRPAPGEAGHEGQQEERRPSRRPTEAEIAQAGLLASFSAPLTIPNSPAEQARRMSINPASRRNSILSIPPIDPVAQAQPVQLDHTPLPGRDPDVDQKELEKELEEIDVRTKLAKRNAVERGAYAC
jgi:hypothetical protein